MVNQAAGEELESSVWLDTCTLVMAARNTPYMLRTLLTVKY